MSDISLVRWIWPACFLLAAFLFLASLNAVIPWPAWRALSLDPGQMSMDEIILAYALLPRAAVALLAGAALGLSGFLLQQVLRNPIADPSTLGISAGAQLAIVSATLFFPAFLDGYRWLVATGGAAAAAAIVFSLGWRQRFEPVTMVIAGMLTGIVAASLSAAFTLSQGEYLMSLVTWNGGSLTQADWSPASSLLLQLLLFGSLSLLLLRPLSAISLGDDAASSLGVPLGVIRFAIILIAVALSAAVAATVGLIGFVGLAAPALARATGIRRPFPLLLASAMIGGLLLWLCDGAIQALARETSETFPTGSVTALIGGPMMLWLLPRLRSSHAVSPNTVLQDTRRRNLRAIGLPLLGVLLIAGLSLLVVALPQGWRLLDPGEMMELFPLRWPRLIGCGAAGGLLALAGAILQRLTGNPLASAEVIGVSGGAGLGYAAVLTGFPAASALGLLGGAATGSLCVLLLVLLFSLPRRLPREHLLLAGIAIGSFATAILSSLMALGDQRAWQILAWIGGTASAVTPASALILLALLALCLLTACLCARWLTVLPLGDCVPSSLGVPVKGSQLVLIVTAALATGAASILVGPLSFVGLVAPHLALRAGFLTARDHLLSSALIGCGLMILADFGARSATAPYELPLGLFAALLGGPYLIWSLSHSRHKSLT
ncbi:Fe(3+)-hydroxamate ABC transporter permease FhuB [Rhizobium sp. SSA_523]|uniref:Fe(3+)-hydroxamate ABC transporter permease FhuB n=1 Tax=Rhizobium sp. SSA_523 TaxID=2952477 RepID=UPI0020913826|nr:Fe(3+)-hydroxamate ABC transporter permease FhuB [Rhizobium sp. SSA_523]MCO5734223.1 Fe(3+)-hydroxamate ABC transporter permease FhuB [Rhizobium sp. SSA_523]WKC21498.1 Fe(3+)-hydroxamate ABC transporter permease FhuB [Rhizobium sp. SSA_523]